MFLPSNFFMATSHQIKSFKLLYSLWIILITILLFITVNYTDFFLMCDAVRALVEPTAKCLKKQTILLLLLPVFFIVFASSNIRLLIT